MSRSHQDNSSEEGTSSARFTTVDLGQHTAEYDKADDTLRLTWSGDQTFLSRTEVRRLYDMLSRILSSSDEDQATSRLSYLVRYGDNGEARASTLEDVAAAILAHVVVGEEFEIIFLDGETEIGSGQYTRGEHEYVIIEETRAACGLMQAIKKLETPRWQRNVLSFGSALASARAAELLTVTCLQAPG